MKQIKKRNSIKKAALCRKDTTGNISQNSFQSYQKHPSLSTPYLAAFGSDEGFKADPLCSVEASWPSRHQQRLPLGNGSFLRTWLLSTPEQNSTEALERFPLHMLHKNLF